MTEAAGHLSNVGTRTGRASEQTGPAEAQARAAIYYATTGALLRALRASGGEGLCSVRVCACRGYSRCLAGD